MLTVREDERQAVVGLHAAYHGFVAMFLSALAVGTAALYLLDDDSLALGAIGVLLVGVIAYHISLWRGGWFAYVREMTNATPADRTRARRQALVSLSALATTVFLYSYAVAGRPAGRAALGAIVGVLVVAALLWWAYLRRPADDGTRR